MAGAGNARGHPSAADLLTPLWRGHVGDLRSRETDIRLQRPGSVHGFRMATRRLRTDLSAFEALLDARGIRSLQQGLRRAAAEVAGTRDVEIVRQRIQRLSLDGDGPGALAAVSPLLRSLDSALLVGWERGRDHLDSAEYDGLVRALDAWSDLPAWRSEAESAAQDVLGPVLRAEGSRFRLRARAALDPDAPETRIRDARKAATRALDVAEELVPALGKKARRIAGAAQQVQDALGEYQDSVKVQAFLSDVRREGRVGEEQLSGDQRKVLTRMRAHEASTAAARRADFARVFGEADRKLRRKGES